MSKENEKTIEVYEKFGQSYLEGLVRKNKENIKNGRETYDSHIAKIIKRHLNGLSKDAKIFEIGSASGRDAKIISSLGYKNIIVSDVASPFLKKLRDEGFDPIKFNIVTDDFSEQYDMIYCWYVLAHLTKDEAKEAIKKMFNALKDGGKLMISVRHKEGSEGEWTKSQASGLKRYFSYWELDEFKKFLEECGYRNIEIWRYGGFKACWFECYAEK